jgi:hypothetical protein
MENNSNFEPFNSAETLFNVTWLGLIQVNIDESGNHHIFSKDRNTIKI